MASTKESTLNAESNENNKIVHPQILRAVESTELGEERVAFFCPACQCAHQVVVKGNHLKTPIWQWNESFTRPTFVPSILVIDGQANVCHSYVREGVVRFLHDCTHNMRDKVVSLESF